MDYDEWIEQEIIECNNITEKYVIILKCSYEGDEERDEPSTEHLEIIDVSTIDLVKKYLDDISWRYVHFGRGVEILHIYKVTNEYVIETETLIKPIKLSPINRIMG